MAYIFDEPSRTFSSGVFFYGVQGRERFPADPGGKVQEGRGIRDQDEHSSRISDHAGSFR